MKNYFLLAILFLSVSLKAQTPREVSGVLRDSTGQTVIGATVKLASAQDTLAVSSNVNGAFTFRNVKSSQFVITVSNIGYQNFVQRYLFKEGPTPIKLDPITLRAQSRLLNEVEVSATKGITVKQDTVEYRASDFPVRENSVAEDVIKKLPGVEVDKDGNVTTQGKSVTRVRVNGKDYFEGDLKTATQNLPAEVIEKIQIIDDYGDQAAITGIREGEADKIINIQLRTNKGMVVNANGGLGSQERYQLTSYGQFMNDDQQLSVILNLNNNNASPFAFGGGGGRGFGGGGRRSGNFGGGGGGGGFGGNNAGITNTTGAGFNYRDAWGKKINFYGSYRFMIRNTDLFSSSERVDALLGRDFQTNSTANQDNDRNFHNLNFNFEYRIDTLNYLRISPNLSFSDNNSANNSTELQTQSGSALLTKRNFNDGETTNPFLGGNVIFNHRFKKLGRNFSFAGTIGRSKNDSYQEARDHFYYGLNNPTTGEPDSSSVRRIDVNNESITTNANFTYSEPLGKYSRVDIGYNFSKAKYDNSRITDVLKNNSFLNDSSLSNVFNYSFSTQRFSLNYRFDKQRLYNFNIGLTAQPTLLDGFSETNKAPVHRPGFNFFPTARFAYNFARTRSFSINYSGRSTEPSFNQIQPVTDVTDVQRPVVGNPDLRSAFTQSLNLSYNTTSPSTGVFFNTGLSGNIINDRITSNIVSYEREVKPGDTLVIQETNYLNADGYYSTNAYYSFGKPFADRKYRISLNGSVNYSNDVTYNSNQKNVGKNWSITQGLRAQINPNQNVEIYPAVGYRRTWLNYTLNQNDNKAYTWSFDLSGRVYFLKTYILGWDGSYNINKGYGAVGINPLIINSYVEKQLFNKKGALRLQTFDVLKEGAIVSRNQSGNSYTNTQNNRLTRYFMLSFNYRFQKFPGGVSPNFNRGRDSMRGNRGGDTPPAP